MTLIAEITTMNDNTVLVLSPEMMTSLGLGVGDKVEVEITTVDRTLTVRPIEEGERARLIAELSEKFIRERYKVFEALAKGAE